MKYSLLSVFLFFSLLSCGYGTLYPTATIEVINESGLVILEIYVALQSDTSWGENRIPSSLASDNSVSLEGIEKEMVKAKVVFENNIIQIVEDIDLNRTEIYRLRILPQE